MVWSSVVILIKVLFPVPTPPITAITASRFFELRHDRLRVSIFQKLQMVMNSEKKSPLGKIAFEKAEQRSKVRL